MVFNYFMDTLSHDIGVAEKEGNYSDAIRDLYGGDTEVLNVCTRVCAVCVRSCMCNGCYELKLDMTFKQTECGVGFHIRTNAMTCHVTPMGSWICVQVSLEKSEEFYTDPITSATCSVHTLKGRNCQMSVRYYIYP